MRCSKVIAFVKRLFYKQYISNCALALVTTNDDGICTRSASVCVTAIINQIYALAKT